MKKKKKRINMIQMSSGTRVKAGAKTSNRHQNRVNIMTHLAVKISYQ